MAAPPPPPPPPKSGVMTKKIPLSSNFPGSGSSPKPPPQSNAGGGSNMSSLMQELSRAIGVPKNYADDDATPPSYSSPPVSPSPAYRGAAKPSYQPPPNLPQATTLGEELVHYSIKGPSAVKVQSLASYELTCRNKDKQLFDMNQSLLEAEITEERNGDVNRGVISKTGRGTFSVQFRGRSAGLYHINLYVKGEREKKPIYEAPGLALKVLPHEPLVTQNMNFTVQGLQGGTVGRIYRFQILTSADDGSPLECDEHKLKVQVAQGMKKIYGTIIRTGNAQYTTEFVPFAPGDNVVEVTYGGQSVIETTLTFNTGIDANHTVILNPLSNVLVGQQYTFTIQARSSTGHDITNGGEKFEVACGGPTGGVTGLVVRDEQTGQYVVRFTLTKTGTYKIFISLRGVEIQGSPMTIDAR